MSRHKISLIIISTLVAALTFGCGKQNVDSVADEASDESEMTEKWAEGTISYEGHHYEYNDAIETYLFMGIDKDGIIEEAENYQSGGQSDAMCLFLGDTESNTAKLIFINRNTMTAVAMYNEDGTSIGTREAQICTQHGFGDGKKLSCNLACDAVSNLFYHIPIKGYFAFNVGGVPILNGYVDGVEVEVLPGLEFLEDEQFKTGEIVTLSDEQAYKYLRKRDISEFKSADMRLERQKQYLSLYIPKAMEKISSDKESVVALYEDLQPYTVTDLDAEKVISELAQYHFDDEYVYEVPGETVLANTGYEEYHIVEEELYKLILELFYKKLD